MTADDLIRLIEIRTSPKLRSLQKRIESGTATLRDSFEYSAAVAGIAGRVLSENIIGINPEERELICTALLRQNHREVNDIFAQVQEIIDRRNGLTLRPRQGEFPAERVQQFAHSLVDPTVEESVIRRRARSGTENITLSFHDDSVRENAKFRNDAGLTCYLDRQTDGKCCPWCSDAAGRYLYGTEPRDIYRRHDNCNCTVIFENGRQRQNVWTKRSWEAPEVGSGNKPKVFSEDEARSIEQRNLSQIRGISVDNSGRSGIMNTITNAVGIPVIEVDRNDITGIPNTITQRKNKQGGIERNYIGADGKQYKQVSNNNHGKPKQHQYGKHGEHAHDYIYDENGELIDRPIRELTDEERKENDDIL